LRYQKLAERRAVWKEDEGPIDLTRRFESTECSGASPSAQRLDDGGTPFTRGRPQLADLADEGKYLEYGCPQIRSHPGMSQVRKVRENGCKVSEISYFDQNVLKTVFWL